ncbi:hypothetical protein BDR26DRAFT_940841 [Obelidium mucronatum]|nr:hypothetical protein BDR26DRAFT_940841 [Obelidium mucronatum]
MLYETLLIAYPNRQGASAIAAQKLVSQKMKLQPRRFISYMRLDQMSSHVTDIYNKALQEDIEDSIDATPKMFSQHQKSFATPKSRSTPAAISANTRRRMFWYARMPQSFAGQFKSNRSVNAGILSTSMPTFFHPADVQPIVVHPTAHEAQAAASAATRVTKRPAGSLLIRSDQGMSTVVAADPLKSVIAATSAATVLGAMELPQSRGMPARADVGRLPPLPVLLAPVLPARNAVAERLLTFGNYPQPNSHFVDHIAHPIQSQRLAVSRSSVGQYTLGLLSSGPSASTKHSRPSKRLAAKPITKSCLIKSVHSVVREYCLTFVDPVLLADANNAQHTAYVAPYDCSRTQTLKDFRLFQHSVFVTKDQLLAKVVEFAINACDRLGLESEGNKLVFLKKVSGMVKKGRSSIHPASTCSLDQQTLKFIKAPVVVGMEAMNCVYNGRENQVFISVGEPQGDYTKVENVLAEYEDFPNEICEVQQSIQLPVDLDPNPKPAKRRREIQMLGSGDFEFSDSEFVDSNELVFAMLPLQSNDSNIEARASTSGSLELTPKTLSDSVLADSTSGTTIEGQQYFEPLVPQGLAAVSVIDLTDSGLDPEGLPPVETAADSYWFAVSGSSVNSDYHQLFHQLFEDETFLQTVPKQLKLDYSVDGRVIVDSKGAAWARSHRHMQSTYTSSNIMFEGEAHCRHVKSLLQSPTQNINGGQLEQLGHCIGVSFLQAGFVVAIDEALSPAFLLNCLEAPLTMYTKQMVLDLKPGFLGTFQLSRDNPEELELMNLYMSQAGIANTVGCIDYTCKENWEQFLIHTELVKKRETYMASVRIRVRSVIGSNTSSLLEAVHLLSIRVTTPAEFIALFDHSKKPMVEDTDRLESWNLVFEILGTWDSKQLQQSMMTLMGHNILPAAQKIKLLFKGNNIGNIEQVRLETADEVAARTTDSTGYHIRQFEDVVPINVAACNAFLTLPVCTNKELMESAMIGALCGDAGMLNKA